MASFQVLCVAVALFLSAFAFHSKTVDGSLIKSMYITWGAQHTAIQGDDLPLVLDQTSGKYNYHLLILHEIASHIVPTDTGYQVVG